MTISTEIINEEIGFYRRMKAQCGVLLRGLPKGKLYFKMEHGKARPYLRRDGTEKYLSAKKKKLIQGLVNRKEIEKAVEALEENIRALEDCLTRFTDLVAVIPSCMDIPDRCRSRNEIAARVDCWKRERAKQYLPEEEFVGANTRRAGRKQKRLKTSDGICVKSKSELIIYEFLKSMGIVFLYEHPVELNGRIRYPDFTILRQSDGKVFYWEHFGMMDLEDYETAARNKLYEYTRAGIWPWRDLIATYDFGDGRVDMTELRRILEMMQVI